MNVISTFWDNLGTKPKEVQESKIYGFGLANFNPGHVADQSQPQHCNWKTENWKMFKALRNLVGRLLMILYRVL